MDSDKESKYTLFFCFFFLGGGGGGGGEVGEKVRQAGVQGNKGRATREVGREFRAIILESDTLYHP